MLRWFRRKEPAEPCSPTAEQQLLAQFLTLEQSRLDKRAILDEKREELELRKLELEMVHLEARTKSQIELEKARQELREKKREAGRIGIAKRRAMARPNAQGCPLCADPNRRDVTIPMIEAHRQHEAAMAQERGN